MSIFNKHNCFFYSGKKYERLFNTDHNFRVILSDDDYDYVENFDLECELFNEFNTHKIAKFVWEHESAPSAVNLVAGCVGLDLEAIEHDPYEFNESHNDKHTEDLIRSASPQEKLDILFEVLDICTEKLEELL